MKSRFCKHEHNHIGIHLLFSEIEFDVKYGVIKRAKFAGIKGDQAKNFAFTESDEDWLMRTIDTAIGNVKSKLKSAYVGHSHIPSDELLEQPKHYDLAFNCENGWLGNADTLMDLIHSYIVNFCIAEYIEMTGNLQVAERISAKADECLLNAYQEINSVIIETPKFIL